MPASAATLTVSTCDESHLDAALASASSGDTITFSCSGDIALTQTLTISQNLTLDGSGQTVTLDGQNTVRVLFVNSGVSFTLNALTIAHGSGPGAGGGIFNYGTVTISNSTLSNNSTPTGGAILNGGTVTISNSTLSTNSATQGVGGGIFNEGTLTISNSTLSTNSAQQSAGGGIYNDGTVTISNSTLSTNSAVDGGGIDNGGTVTISNSTLSTNSATYGGGGIYNFRTAEAVGSIIANNSGGNCTGSISDSGYNLSSDSTCGFTASTSQQNTDPKFDPNGLHNNGGPTQTIALQQGSPAIDQIPVAFCPMTDQRGITRPDNQETTCDMGAYEYQDDAPLTLTRFAASALSHHSAGVAATFTDADPAGQVSDYTARVNWGDGTTSTAMVYKNPVGKGFALAASHSYSKTGTYTLTLTVTDKGGSQVSKTATLTVK